MEKPRFDKGDTVRTLQYLSPLPRGSNVAVIDINESRDGYKYLVEGQHKGQSVRLWTKERDLGQAFVD
jgi:hypothetical protein